MNNSKMHKTILKICVTAMMTAIVFVGNFLRVTMPVPLGGVTSFTLANILCALSGIMLGPWLGFLAAGLGSFFYDLTGIYASEAPITLFTKGMYGLIAGLVLYCLFKNAREKYGAQVAAAACAALSYMAVYSVKTYFYNGMFLQGFTEPVQCWALVVSKIPATITNGLIAIIFAPILGVALMKALRAAHLEQVLA